MRPFAEGNVPLGFLGLWVDVGGREGSTSGIFHSLNDRFSSVTQGATQYKRDKDVMHKLWIGALEKFECVNVPELGLLCTLKFFLEQF